MILFKVFLMHLGTYNLVKLLYTANCSQRLKNVVIFEIFSSLTYKLEISDELTLVIKNNIRVEDLSEERINHLLSLMTSWTGTMQAEINLIDEITVSDQHKFLFKNFFFNRNPIKVYNYIVKYYVLKIVQIVIPKNYLR